MDNESKVSDDFEERLSNSSVGTIDPGLLQFTIRPYDEWPPILKAYGFTDPELISSFAEAVPETISVITNFDSLTACSINQ